MYVGKLVGLGSDGAVFKTLTNREQRELPGDLPTGCSEQHMRRCLLREMPGVGGRAAGSSLNQKNSATMCNHNRHFCSTPPIISLSAVLREATSSLKVYGYH